LGEVRNIRDGSLIRRTDNASRDFLYYVSQLVIGDNDFYVVHGAAQHRDFRTMLDDISAMGVERILQRELGERALILDGSSDEWPEMVEVVVAMILEGLLEVS
jgi:hypothetical protein